MEQAHLRLDTDFDTERIRNEDEFEAAADVDSVTDLQFALENEMNSRVDGHWPKHKETGARICRKNVRIRTRVAGVGFMVGLERRNRLRGQERVYFQEELAVQLDSWYRAPCGYCQLNASDDARTFRSAVVRVEQQIHASRKGADVLDTDAHCAGDSNERVPCD